MRIFRIESFQSPLSPWQVYQSVYSSPSPSFFLDSIAHRKPDQHYSYIGNGPFLEVILRAGRLTVSGPSRKKSVFPAKETSDVLRGLLKKYQSRAGKQPYFAGGAVGFWGYETAPLFDKVRFRKKPAPGTPDLWLGFFGRVIIYDHAKQKYLLAVHAQNSREAQAALSEMKQFFQAPPETKGKFSFRHFRPGISRQKFQQMVRRAKRYIENGDIYQANLSQRFSFKFQGASLKLYDALRKINPSPFASFFKLNGLEIISSSPERLVRKRGRECETRPIAGTRFRPVNPRQACKLEKELKANAKERAEHIMLVDLERNDMGRVCDFRSVRVKELMKVEKYSHVMHLVSKITGRLRPGKDALDLLKAVFPGGTITGCPKIRCMEIIDELEPVRRGIYTGSIGYIDFNGDMDLNIVIRTLILQKNKGYLQAGAGIVYDSDPVREYQETLHKGEALVQALLHASAQP